MRLNELAWATWGRTAPPALHWLLILLAVTAPLLPAQSQQATIINPQPNIYKSPGKLENISVKNTPPVYIINGTCLGADKVALTITGPGINGNTLTASATIKGGTWEYQWYLTIDGTPTGTPLAASATPYTIAVTPSAGGTVGTGSTVSVQLTDGVIGGATYPVGSLAFLPSSIISGLFINGANGTVAVDGSTPIALQIRAFNNLANPVPLTKVGILDPTGASDPLDSTLNLLNLNDDSVPNLSTNLPTNSQATGLPLTYIVGGHNGGTGIQEGIQTFQLIFNDDKTLLFQRSALVDLTAPTNLPSNGAPAINVQYSATSGGTDVILSGQVQDLPASGTTGTVPVSGIGSVEVVIGSTLYGADIKYGATPDGLANWSLKLPSTKFAVGNNTIYTVVKDNAGNSMTSNNVTVAINPGQFQIGTFTVATAAPSPHTTPTNALTNNAFAGGGINTATDPTTLPLTTVAITLANGTGTVNWTLTDSQSNNIAPASGAFTATGSPTTINPVWTTVLGDESDHTLTFQATDASGQTITQSVIVHVDNKRPVATLTAPANSAFVAGTVNIAGFIADRYPGTWQLLIKGTGSNTYSITANGTGTDVTYSWNTAGGTPPPDGTYTITLNATDNNGNISSNSTTTSPSPLSSVTVTLENGKPAPAFTAPVAFAAPATGLYGPSPLTITGTLGLTTTDSNAKVSYTLDGINITKISGTPVTITPTGAVGSATAINGSYKLTTGEEKLHTLTAWVTNSAGITGSTAVTFYVDTLAPRVTIASPTPNQPVSGNVLITGTVTDANPKSWTLTITGPKNYSTTGTGAGTSVNYTWNTAGVADGVYTITLTATDQAGNTTTAANAATVTVTLGNTLPAPGFTAPVPFVAAVTQANGLITKAATGLYTGASLAISGTFGFQGTETNAGVVYTLDGTNIDTITGKPVTITPDKTSGITGNTTTTFSGTYNLTAGEEKLHTLTATVTNSAGVTGQPGSVTFYVDTLAPRVLITAPSNNQPVSGNVLITGTVTDANPKDWTVTITGPNSYNNIIKFIANNASVPGSTSTSVNYTWNTSGLGDGVYTITLAGTDQAGNTTAAANAPFRTVTLSNNPPKPGFTAPVPFVAAVTQANGLITKAATGLYTGASLAINGTFGFQGTETNAGVVYTLDGTNIDTITGKPVTITPDKTSGITGNTTTTFSGTYNLTAGEEKLHTLTATVTNSAGVTGQPGSVTFYVDTLAPRVLITAPSSGQTISGIVPITGTVTDANPMDWTLTISGPGGYSNIIDFKTNNAVVPNSTSTSVNYLWDTTKASNGVLPPSGNYIITLKGTDQAGNVTISPATVTVNLPNFPNPVLNAPVHTGGAQVYSDHVNGITTYYLNGTDVQFTGVTNLPTGNFLAWKLDETAGAGAKDSGTLYSSTTNTVTYPWDTTTSAAATQFLTAMPLCLITADTSKDLRYSNSYQVVVDNVAPQTAVTAPKAGKYVGGPIVNTNAIVSPSGVTTTAPVALTGTVVELNLLNWQFKAAVHPTGASGDQAETSGSNIGPLGVPSATPSTTWTIPYGLEQDWDVFLAAVDKTQNVATTKTVGNPNPTTTTVTPSTYQTVHVDTFPPRITITTSGEVMNETPGAGTQFTVHGSVQDLNLSSAVLTVYAWTNGSMGAALYTSPNLTNGAFAQPVQGLAPNQQYALVLDAKDLAGNESSNAQTPIVITFVTPPTATLSILPNIAVNGTGAAVTPMASTTLTKSIGTYTNPIYILNTAAKSNQDILAGIVTNAFSYILTDNGNTVYGPSTTFTGLKWPRTLATTPSILTEGSHDISLVVSTDGTGGPTATAELTSVIVDVTPPNMSLSSPAPQQTVFPGSTLSVVFAIDNTTGVVPSPLQLDSNGAPVGISLTLLQVLPNGQTKTVTPNTSKNQDYPFATAFANGYVTLTGSPTTNKYTVIWKIDLTGLNANTDYEIAVSGATDVAGNPASATPLVTFKIGF